MEREELQQVFDQKCGFGLRPAVVEDGPASDALHLLIGALLSELRTDARISARPMQFPDATGVPANMLFPQDGRYFEMLARFIDREYRGPRRHGHAGMLHTLGIEKGKPFRPDAEMKGLLDRGARTAFKMSKVVMTDHLVHEPGGKYYPDRQWLNVFAGENTSFQASGTFTNVEQRAAFFTSAYSVSPAMVVNMVGKGAKYPVTARDADGDILGGGKSYRLHLPANIPAANFWSATVYEALTASGLDNGQPLPSLNSMDKPDQNSDGSTDLYLGPSARRGGRGTGCERCPVKATSSSSGSIARRKRSSTQLEARRHREGEIERRQVAGFGTPPCRRCSCPLRHPYRSFPVRLHAGRGGLGLRLLPRFVEDAGPTRTSPGRPCRSRSGAGQPGGTFRPGRRAR